MVPLDGSEKDARALAVAVALANLSGADLHLVRVIDASPERRSEQSEFLGLGGAAVTDRRHVERQLAETAARVEADTGHRVTWAVLEVTHVAEELVRRTAECDARVVVMATRAPGAAARALRGSVADHVMRESPRPVVLVPPGTADMEGKHVQLARVLVPLDGSALAAMSLDFLLALPHAGELEYVLLEVVPPGADRRQAEDRLNAEAGRVRAQGARVVEVAVLEASAPAPAIVAAVREALVDAIAMSTRGASGLRRMVLGSVAEGVVRGSEVPVLLLTPASLAGP
jgi:nucleotide-binding universal stress UspA family protein